MKPFNSQHIFASPKSNLLKHHTYNLKLHTTLNPFRKLAMSPDQPTLSADATSGKAAAAEQAVVKCPRCDSPNTKFCYYNNYSLTQPRHFCKTCRRYWTKGGALRNVPIGGGCRKNKKIKSSSTSSDHLAPLKFFSGPAMDFQLAGLSSSSSFPSRLHDHYPDAPGIGGYSSLMAANYAPPLMGHQEMNGNDNNTNSSSSNLASSIESLSCINQDLHWKLQQQRLAVLFGNNNKDENNNTSPLEQHQQKQSLMRMQPILFQNLDIATKEAANADVATEWFFGNSYAAGGDQGARTAGNWTSTPAWTTTQHHDLNHYSALP